MEGWMLTHMFGHLSLIFKSFSDSALTVEVVVSKTRVISK